MGATLAFDARRAVQPARLPVGLSAITYDADRQTNVITNGRTNVPALQHSTGGTPTNIAPPDMGSDKSSDGQARCAWWRHGVRAEPRSLHEREGCRW